jgi:hypothetical protein
VGPAPGEGPAPGRDPLAGQRAPDLDLRGAPAATLFGLLPPARFILLTLGPSGTAPATPAAAAASEGFAGRLEMVHAELAGDAGEFAGVRAMLIRPDGYIAWATDADEAPPLGRWLGHAS